jgi:single-stranded-DNA-specific exonuclease RecJ
MEESRHWKTISPQPERALELSQALSISPITAQLLINRGVSDAQEGRSFLHGTLADLHSPLLLHGMREATALIFKALSSGASIRIFGDYDVDGVTSTVMLLQFLGSLSSSSPMDYYIPHRIDEGYGLSRKGIEKAGEDGVGLIITVDCGVSDSEEIALAKSLGIEVIVTDHHQVPVSLPCADVIINPRRRECSYPFKDLAGVGVTFKLVHALAQEANVPCPDDFLQLVALGTVADAVPLLGENRILVREGIRRMSRMPLPAIGALLSGRGKKPQSIGIRDLNFLVIPALNAAGRMGDVDVALLALLAADSARAQECVQELQELNRSRKKIEEAMRKEIQKELDENGHNLEEHPCLVMASDRWHPGVLGITASRIAEKVAKPVFLIALKDGVGRGSARSWGGSDIFKMMSRLSDILLHYGGHEGAGGFGIEERHIQEFQRRLGEPALRPEEGTGQGQGAICEGEIGLHEATAQLVTEIAQMAPFGEGNSAPLFVLRGVKIQDCELVGGRAHLRAQISCGEHSMKGIAFKKGDMKSLLHGDLLYDILGTPEIDDYHGSATLVMKIAGIGYPDRNSELVMKAPEKVIHSHPPSRAEDRLPVIIDSRNVGNRLRYIREVGSRVSRAVVVLRKGSQHREMLTLLEKAGLSVAASMPSLNESRSERLLITYPHLLSQISSADDILFMTPPPSIIHFSLPLYGDTKRIHLLFNSIDIEEEENLQRLYEPTVRKMVKIQRAMNALRERGIVVGSPAGIARILDDPTIKEITVQFAFRIFDELKFLKRLGAGYELLQSPCLTAVDLQVSGFFISLRESRGSFARLRELYRTSPDRLRSDILSMIGKSAAPQKTALIC